VKKKIIKNSILREHLPKLIFFGLIIISAIVNSVWHIHKRRLLWNEYPQVFTKDSINDIVTFKYKIKTLQRGERPDCSHVMFENNSKNTFSTYINYKSRIGIDQVLEVSDRIIKHKGSDTVYIYKNNNVSETYNYFFILDTIQYIEPYKKN